MFFDSLSMVFIVGAAISIRLPIGCIIKFLPCTYNSIDFNHKVSGIDVLTLFL